MTIAPRQAAYKGTGDGTRTAKATFDAPTTPGSTLIAIVVLTHSSSTSTSSILNDAAPSGFTRADWDREDELTVVLYYRTNAPSQTSVEVSNPARRSIQLQVFEYDGLAQSSVLDKVTSRADYGKTTTSGSTGTISQADELVIGVIANRYTSSQSGFTGGLGILYNRLSPSDWDESQRSRMTVHTTVTSSTASFTLGAKVSSSRDWVSILATFKGGSTGPVFLTATDPAPMVATDDWSADLAVFEPLEATDTSTPVLDTTGFSARMAPFAYQYLLKGWDGLLIGTGTPWPVESVEGLEGWEMRTSDRDLPRGDGAQRGVDLQSARTVLFKLNMGSGDRLVTEQRLIQLLDALVPQRDEDWELIWRHPGRPVRQARVRPITLSREMDIRSVLLGDQAFALRAVDPRLYGVRPRSAVVPVAPAGQTTVPVVSAVNTGNARAYPVIRVTAGLQDVTRLELVNASAGVRFEYEGLLVSGATLVADMPARVRASGESVITIDGQSRYGGWQFPRSPFHLAPAPDVTEGSNSLYISTIPAEADVTCTVEWRDTWAG